VAQAGLVPKEEAKTLPHEILALGAGDAWRHRTAFVFDEVRVSSRPRNATELGASKPVKDKDVLLLDHLAGSFTPDGEHGRTAPEVSTRPDAGGVPTLGCTFVPAKFGRGVRAVVQPPGSWLQFAHDHLGLTHALDWRWHRYMGALDLLLTPEVFRSRIEAIHRKGLKYYVYTYKAINPLHPNYEEYFHEWGLHPRTRWMNPSKIPTARNYDADSTCANSPYTDYFVASFEKVLKESDLDGIYMDGNTKASLCANSHHGCGYRDSKGQWQGTYPIFATREMLKRLYAVTHLNKPEGIVDVHQSFCLCIPTTSFCDIIYTGEHEPFSPERLPEIRVRYARRAWGIPIETLGSTPLYLRYARRYWAYMLIHDARVRPGGANGRNDMQRKTARIRGVIEPFREPGCQWLPYYRPSPFESRTSQVLVSAWGRPKGDYMLAVACFAKAAGTTESRIKLNLNGEWKATNPLTDEVFSIENKVLHLKLGYEDFRLVHLEKTPRQ
jgi:hypothetical protein